MRLPRFRSDRTRTTQRVNITLDMRRRLRQVGATLDRSCPDMVREAIDDHLIKYQTGQPERLRERPEGSLVNQQTMIAGAVKAQLLVLAASQYCRTSDLLREAIEDFVRRHAGKETPSC